MISIDMAGAPPVPWAEVLRRARKMPMLWIGSQDLCHLTGPITASLRAVWKKGVFQTPDRGLVRVAPNHCLVCCWCGPVVSHIASLLHFDAADILLEELNAAEQRVGVSKSRKLRPIRDDAMFQLGGCAHALYLAEYGALAVRDERGLWCQSYRRGWPTSPPVLLEHDDSGIGLMVAVSLSPEWFRGLPYTEQEVLDAIPEAARPHVVVEWRGQDDVLPGFLPDPEILLGLAT